MIWTTVHLKAEQARLRMSFFFSSSPGPCFQLGIPLSISLDVFQDEVGASSALTDNSVSGTRKMGKETETGHYLIRSLPGGQKYCILRVSLQRETVPGYCFV